MDRTTSLCASVLGRGRPLAVLMLCGAGALLRQADAFIVAKGSKATNAGQTAEKTKGFLAAGAGQPAYDPAGGSCAPQCKWECESSKCAQVCEPICQPPRCETRCSSADYSSCHQDCPDAPQCSVFCPPTCASGNCAECKTTCSEPMCFLKCPGMQPCRNVCETPKCDWHCREPDACPAPICKLACEAPKPCAHVSYHEELPPKYANETSVSSFRAPGVAATMTSGITKSATYDAIPTSGTSGCSNCGLPMLTGSSPTLAMHHDMNSQETTAVINSGVAPQTTDVVHGIGSSSQTTHVVETQAPLEVVK